MSPTTVGELRDAGLIVGDIELSDKGKTWLRALDQISEDMVGPPEGAAEDLILSTFAVIR
jgi:hypothetical protein